MKTPSAKTPRTRRTMTTGEFHANNEPPLDTGTKMNTVAMRLTKLPRKSTFFNLCLNDPVTGVRGRKKMIKVNEMQLTGTVTQNTHLH
jgi:hypothetical protein